MAPFFVQKPDPWQTQLKLVNFKFALWPLPVHILSSLYWSSVVLGTEMVRRVWVWKINTPFLTLTHTHTCAHVHTQWHSHTHTHLQHFFLMFCSSQLGTVWTVVVVLIVLSMCTSCWFLNALSALFRFLAAKWILTPHPPPHTPFPSQGH
jgi:hypothetical protein